MENLRQDKSHESRNISHFKKIASDKLIKDRFDSFNDNIQFVNYQNSYIGKGGDQEKIITL